MFNNKEYSLHNNSNNYMNKKNNNLIILCFAVKEIPEATKKLIE